MKTTYTYYWVHYIRDFPLRRWQLGVVKGIDQELKGNACDDLLFRLARERGVPLITSEGVSPNGKVTKGKLYERLKTADLPVYTPAEYLASRGVSIDEEVACFHRLFRSQRNQDRFKRRYSASQSTNIRRTLRLLERDLRDTLGLA